MPPLIRRPRGLTNAQIGVGVGLGVLCGYYIWSPVLIKYKVEKEKENKEE